MKETTMTKEELTKMENKAWEEFCQDYPTLTNTKWYARLMLAIFGGKGVVRLMWENAWLKGMNDGVDMIMGMSRSLDVAMQLSESSPPEPKSGQPESPVSHSSSHSQGGVSPDANPSK